MSFQIYRFKVLNEISRQGGNVIFAALDTADESPLRLYEWSPPSGESAAAAASLQQAIAELNGTEAFASGPNLYVTAASIEQARKALEVLRSHNLFPGAWPGVIGDRVIGDGVIGQPPPVPVPEPPPPVPPPVPVSPRRLWPIFALIALVTTGSALVWRFYLFNPTEGSAPRQEKTRPETNSGEAVPIAPHQETQENPQPSNPENAQPGAPKKPSPIPTESTPPMVQITPTPAFSTTPPEIAQEKPTPIIIIPVETPTPRMETKAATNHYVLTLHNDCPQTGIDVAIRYADSQNIWITQGWYSLSLNQDRNLEIDARGNVIYLYASGKGWTWDGSKLAGAVQSKVIHEKFVRHGDEEINGSKKRTVSMFPIEASAGPHLTKTFTCP